MKIGIIGSMQFAEKMMEYCDKLNAMGHKAFVTDLHKALVGKTDEEKEQIKLHQKNNMDAIREFWRAMQGADAVLVLNYDKNGIKNYIGGNTLMEIGFAHVLNQKIFLLNPIPDIPYYKTEIEAMKPIILNGELEEIIKWAKSTP
jgi:predicted RNA-binding protein with PUA domain